MALPHPQPREPRPERLATVHSFPLRRVRQQPRRLWPREVRLALWMVPLAMLLGALVPWDSFLPWLH